MLRDWVTEDRRIVSVFFLALAALNGWISYTIYSQHPHMAVLNAAMTAVLVLGVDLDLVIRGSRMKTYELSPAALQALNGMREDYEFQDGPRLLDDVLDVPD